MVRKTEEIQRYVDRNEMKNLFTAIKIAATKIIAHARCKPSRELMEAWAPDENSVNRFIFLAPAYRALRSQLRTGTTAV
ncbi:unnamed protein product [Schistocephalus solidus]|uniref:DDE_Tnp_1_7 domain-containing protein n=1 Tax=Schistocephalus solidus TaxID=70667 RepID=A0A183T1P9_SCHSO|nr:unnamed protein product [Schistocephalus solidus]